MAAHEPLPLPASSSPAAPTAARRDLRAVVAIGDEPLREAVAATLAAAGFDCDLTASGVAGLGLLQQGAAPRVVITNWFLPDVTGERLVAAIRRRHADLPVVVISDQVSDQDYAALLASGATAFLPRGDVALLPDLVTRLTEGQRAPRTQSRRDPPPPPATEFVRESTRHPVALPVSVRVETWDRFAVLYTSNLSRGGLFIRMADPLPVGTALRMRLGLPDGQVMELGATVVHVLSPAHAEAEGRRPGVGVRFDGFTETQRRALATLAETARDSGVTPPRGVPATTSPPTPRPRPPDEERLALDLREGLARLMEQDYFAMLGLAADADAAAARAAFLRLAKQWHPGRFAFRSEAVRAQVAEIFILLRKAHDTLVDPGRAASYRARLPQRAPGPVAAAPGAAAAPVPRAGPSAPGVPSTPAPSPSPPPSRLRAEHLFDMVEAAPAPPPLTDAPETARAVVLRVIARARTARAEGRLDSATEMLKEALEADPLCTTAALLLREISAEQKQARGGIFARLLGRQ